MALARHGSHIDGHRNPEDEECREVAPPGHAADVHAHVHALVQCGRGRIQACGQIR